MSTLTLDLTDIAKRVNKEIAYHEANGRIRWLCEELAYGHITAAYVQQRLREIDEENANLSK